jgi:protein-tyrosine phosphatase
MAKASSYPKLEQLWSMEPEAPDQILDFLYLGSEESSISDSQCSERKIRYILNITLECRNYFEHLQNEKGEVVIHYLKGGFVDHPTEDMLSFFPKGIAFIEYAREQGCSVLVHCAAGVSRSATMVIAYVMFYCGYNRQKAFRFVHESRPKIEMLNFGEQLKSWEERLRTLGRYESKHFDRHGKTLPVPLSLIDAQPYVIPPLPSPRTLLAARTIAVEHKERMDRLLAPAAATATTATTTTTATATTTLPNAVVVDSSHTDTKSKATAAESKENSSPVQRPLKQPVTKTHCCTLL